MHIIYELQFLVASKERTIKLLQEIDPNIQPHELCLKFIFVKFPKIQNFFFIFGIKKVVLYVQK